MDTSKCFNLSDANWQQILNQMANYLKSPKCMQSPFRHLTNLALIISFNLSLEYVATTGFDSNTFSTTLRDTK